MAVFLPSYMTAPIIGFNDYNSTSELVRKVEKLESGFVNEMRILDLLPERSFQYVLENKNRNSTVINIIFCENCFMSTNTNFKSFSSLLSIYTIVFVFTESKITLMKRYKFFHFIPTKMTYMNRILTNMEMICDRGVVNSRYKIDITDVMLMNQAFSERCKTLDTRLLVRDFSKYGFKETISSLLLEHLSSSRASGFLFSVGLCRIKSRESQIAILVHIELGALHTCHRLSLSFKRANYSGFWFQALSEAYDLVTICEYDMNFFLVNCESVFVSQLYQNYVIRNNTFQETSLSGRVTRLFACDSNHGGELIPYSVVNDGFEDCSYAKDEVERYCRNIDSGCYSDGILFNKFRCSNTVYSVYFDKYSRRAKHKKEAEFVYISRAKRCDGIFDCSDGADEFNCSECMETSVSDGTCLPSQWFYDESRRNFSFSRRDRPIDLNKLAVLDEILTTCNTTDCVQEQNITFDVLKCRKGSGVENNRNISRELYLNNNHNVWAARCVYLRGQYTEEIFGCADLSHLKQCEYFVCSDGFFKCQMSYCVPYYMINDGVIDCEDGGDEIVDDLNQIFQANFFKCRWSLTIIHPVHVCDGRDHCPTGDDESLCTDSCPSGFKCELGVTAVDDHSQIILDNFTNDLDIDTRVLDLSGVNLRDFSFDSETQLNDLAEIYLSRCHLNNTNLLAILDSLNIFYNKLNKIDLSYNKDLIGQIDIVGNKLTNLMYLNLSQTGFITFNMQHDLTRFKAVDLSFSKIQTFMINTDSPFGMLNLSNTPFDNKQCQSNGFILDLDLRKTNLKYTAKDIECLKQLKAVFVDMHPFDSEDFMFNPAKIYGDSFKLCCVYREHTFGQTCHAPEDSISSCYGLMGDTTKRTFIRVASIMGALGSFAVILCIFLYHKMFCLCSLRVASISFSMSEFLMSLYLITVAGIDNYYGEDYYTYDLVWRYSIQCIAAGFLALLSYITTNVLMLVFTLDYILLLYRNKRHSISRFGLVSIVWLISYVFAMIPFLFPHWELFESNSMCLGLPFFVKHPTGWVFSFFVFVLLLICNVTFFVIGLLFTRKKILEISLSTLQYTEINEMRHLNVLFLFRLFCMLPVCILSFLQDIDQLKSNYMMGLISVYFYPMECLYCPFVILLNYLVLAVLSGLK